MENPKHETPEHFETEVANYIQLGLIRRYVEREREREPNHTDPEWESKCRTQWIEKNASKFRALFNESKMTFLQFYKENREELVKMVEDILEKNEE